MRRPRLDPRIIVIATRFKGSGEECYEVMYPVSYRYNGGTIVNGKWQQSIIVDPPVLPPPGWKFVDICVGLELNAKPPLATKLLVREEVSYEESS